MHSEKSHAVCIHVQCAHIKQMCDCVDTVKSSINECYFKLELTHMFVDRVNIQTEICEYKNKTIT